MSQIKAKWEMHQALNKTSFSCVYEDIMKWDGRRWHYEKQIFG